MKDHIPYTILLVDDDAFLVGMYSHKFTQAGHTIHVAQSVKDAVTKLKDPTFSPDAIILDLVMPHMDGFSLLEHIHNNNLAPGVALIVLSNQNEQEDIERARALGAVGHIIKANAVPSEVLTSVERIIAQHTQER